MFPSLKGPLKDNNHNKKLLNKIISQGQILDRLQLEDKYCQNSKHQHLLQRLMLLHKAVWWSNKQFQAKMEHLNIHKRYKIKALFRWHRIILMTQWSKMIIKEVLLQRLSQYHNNLVNLHSSVLKITLKTWILISKSSLASLDSKVAIFSTLVLQMKKVLAKWLRPILKR